MQNTYGNINESLDIKEKFKIEKVLDNIELLNHWERCNDISNKLADEITSLNTCLSKDLVSHIINELIENAVKYSNNSSNLSHISCLLYDNLLEIKVKNNTNSFFASKFDSYIEDTFQEDLENIFFKYLLQAAESDNKNSGIGLLIIRKDFNAKIGLIIKKDINLNDTYPVEVCVQVDLKDLMQ